MATYDNKIVDGQSLDIVVKAIYDSIKLKQNISDSSLQTVAKTVVGAINELNKKCPYDIGDIYTTTKTIDPSTIWIGTTWQELKDVFLKSTADGETVKQISGSNTKIISKANLPNIKLNVDSHYHTQADHYHYTVNLDNATSSNNLTDSNKTLYIAKSSDNTWNGGDYTLSTTSTIANAGKTSSAVGGNTGSATTKTEAMGSGSALDIKPRYYTVKHWLRIS